MGEIKEIATLVALQQGAKFDRQDLLPRDYSVSCTLIR